MTIQANFPAIKPSLMLDFANTKQLDSRITYTRASTASYYDGVTTSMAEQNLVPYSQQLDDASWSKTRVTVTANATTAPDGTSTAEAVFETAVTNTFNIAPATNSVISGQAHTLSIFVKANGRSYVAIYEPFLDVGKYFNVTAGGSGTVLGNLSNAPTSATITAVGNDWFRCTITATTSSTSLRLTVYASDNGTQISYAGDASKGLYLWGAQVEQRSAVTAYTATTTQAITNYIPKLQSAASGVARFDNNPTTGESLGLLIEESRTNLLPYSEQFDNGIWTKTRSSITANTIVAPDGSLTGDKLVEDTSASNSHFVQGSNQTVTLGNTHTISLFAKAGERTQLAISDGGTGSSASFFNLSSGTLVSAGAGTTSTSITGVGNGWYRCSITFNSGSAFVAPRFFTAVAGSISYTGDGFSGIFIWGAQAEAGAFATSYIPTVASQVTRAADAASMTGTNFSTWFNQAQGTLLMGVSESINMANLPSGNLGGVSINASGTTPCIDIIPRNGDFNCSARGVGGGSTSNVSVSTTRLAGTQWRVGLTYTTDPLGTITNAAANGVGSTGSTKTANSMIGMNQLEIGKQVTSGTTIGTRHFQRVVYYPLVVTTTQLQALTS